MGQMTKIEWCHHTFNPWRGCSKVHTGCENCYAWRDSKRFRNIRGVWGPNGTRVRAVDWRSPLHWNAAAEHAQERRRVFCASLADVFEDWTGPILDHNGEQLFQVRDGHRELYLPGERARTQRPASSWPATMKDLRRDLFDLIDSTPWLDWLLVTKRPENIGRMWPTIEGRDRTSPPRIILDDRRENVWLLTSVSDQATADEMMPRLLEWRHLVPVLGVSVEPLLGPIDFTDWIGCECAAAQGHCDQCLNGSLDWIIFGGESGPGARQCDLPWLMYGLGQCQDAGVACFMKQFGSNAVANGRPMRLKDPKGGDPAEWPADLRVRQFPVVERSVA